MDKGYRAIQYHYYASGLWEKVDGATIMEAPVSLTVNGHDWLTFMCTPRDQEALAVGFLYNENLIESIDEVAAMRVCPAGDNVDLWLEHAIKKPKKWRRTSGCTGGMTATEFAFKPATPISNGWVLSAAQIGSLIAQLFDSQELYRKSGGVHTSALSDGERLHVVAEDIGRHNTLDKIAGRCLIEGIQLPRRVLLTTGRISSEMMQKSARIGAAIVISRTSPSSLSIQAAQQWGITLIGYARRDRFNVYTHPERIVKTQALESIPTLPPDLRGQP